MRSSALAPVFVVFLATHAFAQSPPPPQNPQNPPAAAGEAGKKPTRNFPSALAHNLWDDVKHLPRQNSGDGGVDLSGRVGVFFSDLQPRA